MQHRLPRLDTPGRRLGLGIALAGTAHIAGLALLAMTMVRAGHALLEGDGEGDRVDVSTVGEAGAGLAGSPVPAAAHAPGETASEARPRASRPHHAPAHRSIARLAPPQPPPILPTAAPLAVGTGAEGDRSALPGAAGAPSPLAAFRAELKQNMRAAWRAREVYQKIDPEGRLEGSLLITSLHVRLRADGTVEKAELRDSSGVAALDSEAMSAIHRMKPLSHVPTELIDPRGGAFVRCAFHLDLGQYRFANQLRRAVADQWRPARAFMVSGETERVTRVRLMLDRAGKLLSASVLTPSGLDFLDNNALAWARPGLSLPAPPPAFHRAPGEVPVFVAFYHLAGQVHFLWPREDLEGD